MSSTVAPGSIRLGEAFDLPPVVSANDFVLQLQSGVEAAGRTVGEYVVTDSLAGAFDTALAYVGKALTGRQDQGIFVHGSFGSGKSHFLAVLDLLLRGAPEARALPGLQQAVAKHGATLGADLLTVDYHLIGAESFEQALFSGYLARVRALHPDKPLPLLHRSDALFTDAAGMRARMGDDAFFAGLGGGAGSDEGWGDLGGGWDAASYDRAAAAPVGDPDRERLAAELVAAYFQGYTAAGAWLDVSEGLGVMATHAKSLGYEGIVLFLDELVLWLASHLSDLGFVQNEGSKVAKLVETGIGQRAVPIVSFVARQRELKDFLGDSGVGGAARSAVGDTFRWWEGRFDRIGLQASDLPEIAHKRLLQPRTTEAADAVAAAVAQLKSHKQSWDALLTDGAGADEAAFAKIYPFSPALVDTLVALSGLLQRERTALKVMAQLLVSGRDELTLADVIAVGDLFDVMVAGDDQPLTDEMRHHFDVARRLYRDKLRPVLLETHRLTDADAAALPRTAPFRNDDRLVKTLLIAALAPGVPALKNITASKLAALNHGSVKAFVPGTEAVEVLRKVRGWAQQVGELTVGEGSDPVIGLQLSGVDYEQILELVAIEDTDSARRTLLRRLVFDQLAVPDPGLFNQVPVNVLWRGTKRELDVVFGNIRDESGLPDDLLRAQGDRWKLVVDYPFDEGDHGPQEDVNRFGRLRSGDVQSRTVGWVPRFLTRARQDDLGTLVRLEHLLGGTGEAFDRNAQQLPVDQRPIARQMLANKRSALRAKLDDAIKQAYGVAARDDADVDASHGSFDQFPSLDPGLEQVQPPVGATLGDAMRSLADQMLSSQYPQHPRFEQEVRKADLVVVLDHVEQAVQSGGRVDPVEQSKRPALRRVANQLKVGEAFENHYAFSAELFPFRNDFLRRAAEEGLTEIPVPRIRAWLADRGLQKDVQNLLVLAWARLDDKQFARHGATVAVRALEQVTDDLVLRDPQLPADEPWRVAVDRAAILFGVHVAPLKTAANLARLGEQVREKAGTFSGGTASLVAELQRHKTTLGLQDTSPRLLSALLGNELVGKLHHERDDLTLVAVLAEAGVPSEPQPLAHAIATAERVAGALRAATWQVLDAVAGMDTPAALDALAPLRAAADHEELHDALEPALRLAVQRATELLVKPVPVPPPGSGATPGPTPPPGPTTPPPVSVDEIELPDVDAGGADLLRRLREAAAANPGRRLRVKWWFE